MSGWWIIALAIIAVPVAWFFIRFVVGASASQLKSGLAYFDQKLSQLGTLPSGISEGAREELVVGSLDVARIVTATPASRHRHGDFRTYFIKDLDSSAQIVHSLLKGEPTYYGSPTHNLLLRYRAMSA